jgi:hypothetical protein
MAAKTVYKATIATDGALNDRVGAYDGVVPYFVSGPLHRDVGVVGALGATLHVSAWIIALIMDILILSKLDGGKVSDSIHYDYWMSTFIPLVVGLAVVVIATLLHAFTTMKACLVTLPSNSTPLNMPPSFDRFPRAGCRRS